VVNQDQLATEHFEARRIGAFFQVVNKETGEIVQTTVAQRLPRKRHGQPIRSKVEALSAVMSQEVEWLKAALLRPGRP